MPIYINIDDGYEKEVIRDVYKIISCLQKRTITNDDRHFYSPRIGEVIWGPGSDEEEEYNLIRIDNSILSGGIDYISPLNGLKRLISNESSRPVIVHAIKAPSFYLSTKHTAEFINTLIHITKNGRPTNDMNFFTLNEGYGGFTVNSYNEPGISARFNYAREWLNSTHVFYDPDINNDVSAYRYVVKNKSNHFTAAPSWVNLYHELVHAMGFIFDDISVLSEQDVLKKENDLRRSRGLEERSYSSDLSHIPYERFFHYVEKFDHNWHLRCLRFDEFIQMFDHLEAAMKEEVLIAVPSTGWTRHPAISSNETLLIGKSYNFSGPGEGEDINLGSNVSMYNRALSGTSLAGLIIAHNFNLDIENFNLKVGGKKVEAVLGVSPYTFVTLHKVASVEVNASPTNISDLSNCIIGASMSSGSYQNTSVIVITMGWKSKDEKKVLEKALKEALKKGVIVIAACGESNILNSLDGEKLLADRKDFALYPGNSKQVISVIGCNESEHVPKSGYGLYVSNDDNLEDTDKLIADIIVPGWGLTVAATAKNWSSNDNVYYFDCNAGGTGFAAALLAGACSLWIAHHGRAQLIRTYTAPYLFYAFKLTLLKSHRPPVSKGRPNPGFEEWKQEIHGGNGILDVVKLLNPDNLPSVREVETAAN